jgi:ribosome-binding protein aMBF1 (putative translation factor)
MAKYSTGDLGGGSSGACELCGREDVSLETATVAGAELEVCSDCAKHGDSGSAGDSGDEERDRDRRRKAAQNTAKLADAQSADTDWEDGADYDDDQLPYLVSGYGQLVENARQAVGLQIEELAREIDVSEDDVVAVEQGRAARANVGGSVVEALEERLEIDLVDE